MKSETTNIKKKRKQKHLSLRGKDYFRMVYTVSITSVCDRDIGVLVPLSKRFGKSLFK